MAEMDVTRANSRAFEKSGSQSARELDASDSAPDGGAQAWLQVLCAWLVIVNTWGFANAYGAFQTHYASMLPESNSTISWIGSTQACLLFTMGAFSGRALDAGYFRATIVIGIALQILGIFSMSAAKAYWQLLMTHGICVGLGGGLYFIPIVGTLSTYFKKRQALAIGIATTGNSMGGILYPLAVRELVPKVGFAWTVRILGLFNVVTLAVVIALSKPRLRSRKSGPIFDNNALRDVPYVLHVLGMCCLQPPMYCASYYIASFARDNLNMPYTASLNMVIILNGAGLPFRILPGYLADYFLGVLNVFILAVLLMTVLFWSWLAVHSIRSYYIWTVIYGLCCAAPQSLFPTTLKAYSSDETKTGSRLGMGFAIVGLSALVGGPITGALLQTRERYDAAIYWASASSVIGLAFCVAARVWKHGCSVKRC